MPRRCHMSSSCRFLGKLVNFSAWETFIYLAIIVYLIEQFEPGGSKEQFAHVLIVSLLCFDKSAISHER